ncbi:MAG TPA: SchA/CurD-like domain-containing protein [Pseudonocardiaceae bacterium]|nr:SchA/CurD-like domain-containing protein [Pseudonocardiaceae bacterium]
MSSWHAVRYPIKAGSEERVKELFRNTALPPAELTATTSADRPATRLLSTMVFVGPGSAVRLIEFEGELSSVIAHLAGRKEARTFQTELAQYLQTDHDLRGPGIGAFFRDATLQHVPVGG